MANGSWTMNGRFPTVLMSDGIPSHFKASVAGINITKVINCAGKCVATN